MAARYKTGVITVPSSTGTMAVTGLGGTRKDVFFMGTNWLAEDTAVTSAGTGIFRGMAARDYSAGTISNSSSSVVVAGDAHHTAGPPNNVCTNMLDTSGGLSF